MAPGLTVQMTEDRPQLYTNSGLGRAERKRKYIIVFIRKIHEAVHNTSGKILR